MNAKTRAIYLINPHNPTGTINDDEAFKSFLRESSQSAVVVVDEAYLEYTSDFATRSAVSLVREGANVVVFRTFDKIHGLAGMPIGCVLAPRSLADALRKQGAGEAEYPPIRLANRTAGGVSEFGRSVLGCPGGGRQFGDSTDWKITQSRQDGTQIVADRDFEAPAGCDQRDDRCNTRPSLLASDVDPVLPSEL